jgi:hypothetical protein
MVEMIYILIALLIFGISLRFFFRPKKSISISQINDKVFLEIKVVKPVLDEKIDIQSDPLAAEQLFSVIHGILREGVEDNLFSFEIVVTNEKIKFIVVTPRILENHITSQIYAQYPLAQITKIDDYASEISNYSQIKVGSFTLAKNQAIPILTFRDFEIDPLSAITSSLGQVKSGEGLSIQLVVKPTPDTWQISGYDFVTKIKKKESSQKAITIRELLFIGIIDIFANIIRTIFDVSRPAESAPSKAPAITALSQSEEAMVKGIENKLTRMGFDCYIRVVSYANTEFDCTQNYNSCMATFKQFSRASLNGFVEIPHLDKNKFLDDFISRRLSSEYSYVLNTEELASIYHLPSSSVENPNISWAPIKISEIPENLPTTDCVKIGRTSYRGKVVEFGIKDGPDRLRHMYMIGKTGAGKSSLFLSMIVQDILKGNGVGVIDPHGELVKDVLQYIPENRIQDVILIDPSDIENPVGINVMELFEGENLDKVTSDMVNAFKSIFAESWGPRLEYILRNTISAMLQVPGTSILGIKRLLSDDDYRKFILSALSDVAIKDYFEREFAAFKANPKLVTESISPIQNKIGPFETIKSVRNILCQRKSTINFREAMDSKKIVLINLSKGLAGEDVLRLFGALIVARIQSATMSRANVPSDQRVPFYLYIDEFQNFTTDTFEEILSESRKYGLGLYLTNQLIGQLSEKLRDTVFGNVGTIVSYLVGPLDAPFLKEIFPPFTDKDLLSLPKFNIITSLMVDGSSTKPFNAEIIKPWETFAKTGNEQKIIEFSRQKYGTNRAVVEANVEKWITKSFKGVKYSDIAGGK